MSNSILPKIPTGVSPKKNATDNCDISLVKQILVIGSCANNNIHSDSEMKPRTSKYFV